MFLLPNTSYFSSLTLDKIHYMYITCTSSTTIILGFFTSHLFSISLLIPNPHQLAQHHAFASVPDIWLCQFAELHFICCRAALGAADPATSLGLRVPLVRAVQQCFGDQAVGSQPSSAPSFFAWQPAHNGCCTIQPSPGQLSWEFIALHSIY